MPSDRQPGRLQVTHHLPKRDRFRPLLGPQAEILAANGNFAEPSVKAVLVSPPRVWGDLRVDRGVARSGISERPETRTIAWKSAGAIYGGRMEGARQGTRAHAETGQRCPVDLPGPSQRCDRPGVGAEEQHDSNACPRFISEARSARQGRSRGDARALPPKTRPQITDEYTRSFVLWEGLPGPYNDEVFPRGLLNGLRRLGRFQL